MVRTAAESAPEVGVRLIVVYKLGKAAGELLLGALLAVVLAAGEEEHVHGVAVALSEHVTGAWSLRLTELLSRAATPRTVELTTFALLLDGVLTAGEGWALYRGFSWAPWMVVFTTGSLVPFELFELARHPRVGRSLILVVNLSVVCYLAAGIRAAARSGADSRAARVRPRRRSGSPT